MNTAKKIGYPINEAQIVSINRREVAFKLVSDREFSHSEIGEAQKNAGYHPDGYGTWGLKVVNENGLYFHTWGCSATCD